MKCTCSLKKGIGAEPADGNLRAKHRRWIGQCPLTSTLPITKRAWVKDETPNQREDTGGYVKVPEIKGKARWAGAGSGSSVVCFVILLRDSRR